MTRTLSGMFPHLDKDVIDDVVRAKDGRYEVLSTAFTYNLAFIFRAITNSGNCYVESVWRLTHA